MATPYQCVWVPLFILLMVACTCTAVSPTLIYSWVQLNYDWPNASVQEQYVASGKYVTNNNILIGIKVFGDNLYVTVPRWKPGVPSTLSEVVMKDDKPVLRPFPSWSAQAEGDCNALQFVMSMEVDAVKGHMWVIDTGRMNIYTDTVVNKCPPKLVIYDIKTKKEIRRHVFPNDVVDHTNCWLNDIVVDFVDDEAKFAYISDNTAAKIYVYDFAKDTSWALSDGSMKGVSQNGHVNGVALSSDFSFLYYAAGSGHSNLHQVPTSILREKGSPLEQHVRTVGRLEAPTGGIAYAKNSLYYGVHDLSGANRWPIAQDAKSQGVGYGEVRMETQEAWARDETRMLWVDSWAVQRDKNLYFTCNNLLSFLNGSMDFSGASGPNMWVWKAELDDDEVVTLAAERDNYGHQTARSGASSQHVHVSILLIALSFSRCLCRKTTTFVSGKKLNIIM